MTSGASPLPPRFLTKKNSILSQLALDPSDYDDKSPKGSVDAQIFDLIRLINGVEGWVTTSSCAGRVAVFVEGPKKEVPSNRSTSNSGEPPDKQFDKDAAFLADVDREGTGSEVKTAPGGKGGGRWLFVSHDPPDVPDLQEVGSEFWTQKFGMSRNGDVPSSARLIHLTYSPLILHVLCATLDYAKPLLAAAINAGFRESGVQSLKALDPDYDGDGVMVAIRTNGIVFESVIGLYDPCRDSAAAIVSEEYLAMCTGIVGERFRWNEVRKERLVQEIVGAMKRTRLAEGAKQIETKDDRRQRKRQEGLARQKKQQAAQKEANVSQQTDNVEDHD
ncbi:tRNA wybutosine-synthesizing protein 3 [Cyphellophora attinorum]|uniref:tRNA(Phe) 7-[(3-amino-3-carboxypropyl)-4-demethylwyosine(37)-N(4)]-methyltransferase n=1 Tax=Cyphellophora attinorum TaxID=1664694 RepID=A0A0N1HTI1_9EURO|nr:tRNA wybutosine-synthesizing protein 3 [Phialophora attinorum]KPI42343.1 tRNA wybutosine-synthesizing protein 3 [Phialophora attinorum]